jgi:hypothetical protein
VEGRCPAGLYLEMTDRPIDDYAATRVPEVCALDDVERATWWRNVHRDRADLPRVLDEFDHLALFEVGPRFAAPASTPPDVRGLHMRRTARPGQGSLSGKPTLGLSVVLISAKTPEGTQALRDWADFVHIRHIAAAAIPGYTMITPYEHATGGDPRYLHLYEMDTDDPERAFLSMRGHVCDRIGGPGTGAFDEWAWHPQLWIMYVNSFERVGASG